MKEDQQFQSALRVLRDTAAYSGLLSGDAAGQPRRRTGAGGPPDSSEPTANLHPEDPEQAVPLP